MAGWYPGAVRVDVGGNGNRITARPPENVLHIAASSWNVNVDNPTSLEGISGWIEQGSTEAHTYNDQFGFMLQYCDLFLAVDGTKDGNWRNRTHEAWNPPQSDGDLNDSRYTPEQCERFSDFLAWDSKENGVLLQNMRNSRRESHGVGAHRYGITGYNPWKTVGGEVWSTSSSKICPGTERVNQLDGIIARAIFIRDHNLGTLPPGRVNLVEALKRGGQPAPPDPDPTPNPPTVTEDEEEDMYKLVRGDSGPNQGMVFAAAPGRFFHVADPQHYAIGVATGLWKDSVQTMGLADLDVLRDICISNNVDKDMNIVGNPLPSDYVQGKV